MSRFLIDTLAAALILAAVPWFVVEAMLTVAQHVTP